VTKGDSSTELPSLELDDDLESSLGDTKGSSFGKKNSSFKLKSDSEDEDEFGGAFGRRKKETVTVNGRELQLVEDDEMSISEAESNWDGDKVCFLKFEVKCPFV